MAEKIIIELSKAEALVLFELLARFDKDEKLIIENQAEARVLWNVHCSLEKVLVEPFSPDYEKLLTEARTEVGN